VNVAEGDCLKRLVRRLAVVVLLSFYPLGACAAAVPVTVYYFHSTQRCETCLEIERFAGEILQERFPQELASGQLSWRPVNIDLPENSHFIFDYDLAANALVVVRDGQGARNDWEKLPDVWKEIQNPGQFRTKLVNLVRRAALPAKETQGRQP